MDKLENIPIRSPESRKKSLRYYPLKMFAPEFFGRFFWGEEGGFLKISDHNFYFLTKKMFLSVTVPKINFIVVTWTTKSYQYLTIHLVLYLSTMLKPNRKYKLNQLRGLHFLRKGYLRRGTMVFFFNPNRPKTILQKSCYPSSYIPF